MLRSVLSAALLCALPALSLAAAPAQSITCDDASGSTHLEGSQCMTVEVPLHHATPEGETLSLFVRRIPARPAEARRGEVWLLSGGPGESGASLYTSIPAYQRAFPGYDLIIPDHRGTGRSSRICPQQEAADSPGGKGLVGEEWGPCIGTMYANVARTSAFSISEAAQDLSHLISQQRGQGQVLVYGVSYGTQLALRMLQAAPVPLDGLVLDGLVPPEATVEWDLSRRTALVDQVGRQVLGADNEDAYKALLARSGEAAWRETVPGGDLRRFFAALLSFPELRDRIPLLVRDLSQDDVRSLQAAVTDWTRLLGELGQSGDDQPALPLVMLIAASENNPRPDLTKETVESEAKDALFVSPLPGLLVNSPVPTYSKDASFGKTPKALPRTLVVHGTLDPNTAYAGAKQHAATLSKVGEVRFHTVEGGAHFLALVAPQCFADATRAFVSHQEVPEHCQPVSASRPR